MTRLRLGMSIGLFALSIAGGAVGVHAALLEGSTPEASTLDQDPAEPPVVDCHSRIQVIPGGREFAARRESVLAGPVTFVGAKLWADDPRRDFRPRPEQRLPVKVPVEVEARRAVTITLSQRVRRHAALEIGLDQAPYRVRGPSVELRSCPPNATVANRRVGRRTPFLGGFKIDGPRCLAVNVEAEGRPEMMTRRIAFGRQTCRAS